MKIILTILLSISVVMGHTQTNTAMNKKAILVIHGGAGTILKKNLSPAKEEAYHTKLEEALRAGEAVLKDSGSATNAVIAAIEIMENSPLFNAGKGAVFTHEETNELDASIMDGNTLEAGAVSGVTTIKNPIKLARAVMDSSHHVMLSGEGAEKYAEEQNIEIVSPDYFKDEIRLKQLKKVQDSDRSMLDHDGDAIDTSEIEFNVDLKNPDHKYGTVGAVALDKSGNLSAGTSTGGMTNKKYGRIGDSPIIGAGTYANNATCGVSCTGHGEYFIRQAVAHDLHARMQYLNESVEEAARKIIHGSLLEHGGKGGLIALDVNGDFTLEFNTAGMYRGVLYEDGTVEISLYGKE